MIGDSNDENNFPHELVLTDIQVPRLSETSGLSAIIKLSKTQLCKMLQLGGFLGRFLELLLKTRLPLVNNVLKLLAKSVLIPLRLTAAVSAADVEIHKKSYHRG